MEGCSKRKTRKNKVNVAHLSGSTDSDIGYSQSKPQKIASPDTGVVIPTQLYFESTEQWDQSVLAAGVKAIAFGPNFDVSE